MTPKLSICIPTYNFGEFIGETIESIVNQAPEGVEMVVVDGASTDNTQSVVNHWQIKYPGIKYFRLEKRGGIDRDLARSVELASGDYCWLFSSDDVMRPYAIQRLVARLNDDCDIYVCEHSICDKNMRIQRGHPLFSDDLSRVVEFSNSTQRRECMAAGGNTEVLFSFMSGLIVSRKKWLSVSPDAEFVGSCWWHVVRLLELARTQLRVCYVSEDWLDKRGDNDSFLERGLVNRFKIAVDGFVRISTHFYGAESVETGNVRRYLRNELSLGAFLYARDRAIQSPDLENILELDRMFDTCYGNCGLRGWAAGVLYYHLPVPVYHRLKALYKFMRSGLRWARGRARK